MVEITLQALRIEQTAAKFLSAAHALEELDESMDFAVDAAVDAIQGYTPVVTGNLRGSIRERSRTRNAGVITAFIGTDVPYAFWINYGYYYSGRPGRRKAGPAHYFENGLLSATGRILDVFYRAVRVALS